MKKIFLWGNYDFLYVGGIKILKEKEDFLLLNMDCRKNLRQQIQLMIDSVKHVKNTDPIGGYRSMFQFFHKEKPDFLAVVSGHLSVETMDEFNRTKLFCEENESDLVVIKSGTVNGLICLSPYAIYEQISPILTKELQ